MLQLKLFFIEVSNILLQSGHHLLTLAENISGRYMRRIK